MVALVLVTPVERKVVWSVWVVWSELGFMGVAIGALYWWRKVVLSVWVVWSK